MDGWTNSDHPTEATLGGPASLPAGANPNDADIDYVGTMMPPPASGATLTDDEKILIARWIDLGAPATSPSTERADRGWFADDLKPTLFVEARPSSAPTADWLIRIGAFYYYSGLDDRLVTILARGVFMGYESCGVKGVGRHTDNPQTVL